MDGLALLTTEGYAASSPGRSPRTRLNPPARSQGLRAYRAVVPGGVGYQDDYQVAGDDYPGMRMQPKRPHT
jgi:hypothetical protein